MNASVEASCTSPTRPSGIPEQPASGSIREPAQPSDRLLPLRSTTCAFKTPRPAWGSATCAVVVNRSVFSGHSGAGIAISGTGAAAQLNLNSSIVSNNNGFGIQNQGGNVTIRLSNNDIAFNGTAISGASQSFTTNRIAGNGSVGTAPTPIGATSNPTGQQ
jgi:hypothetical protein